LQIEKGFRRKGLGRFMMKVLELLAIKADMLKIMATIFKNDKPEVRRTCSRSWPPSLRATSRR
jgi:hypothetical protein